MFLLLMMSSFCHKLRFKLDLISAIIAILLVNIEFLCIFITCNSKNIQKLYTSSLINMAGSVRQKSGDHHTSRHDCELIGPGVLT